MPWSLWIVGLIVCAGPAKLLAVSENYIHGYALRRPTLRRIRGVHNVLLLGVPALALWSVASLSPTSQQHWWRELAPGWWVWIAWGAIGTLVLVASSVRYLTYRPPACQVDNSSRIVDIQARVGESLTGAGRARGLAMLPFNEQFTLEVNEKTYHLPRLPREWDGLSIVHVSDLHFRGAVTRRYFEEVMTEAEVLRGDIIAFTGDLLDNKNCLDWISATLGRLSAPLGCYFVFGNHDWYMPVLYEMRELLSAQGWTNLAGRTVELERSGARLLLAGNELPWMGTAPELSRKNPGLSEGLASQSESTHNREAGPSESPGFTIALAHTPDQIVWAKQNGVDLLLAGHTHGGQIRFPILGPVYSPSFYSCRYASGVFWDAPTLMHVTRGISGREPIRYLCRPELTKLIVRSAVGG